MHSRRRSQYAKRTIPSASPQYHLHRLRPGCSVLARHVRALRSLSTHIFLLSLPAQSYSSDATRQCPCILLTYNFFHLKTNTTILHLFPLLFHSQHIYPCSTGIPGFGLISTSVFSCSLQPNVFLALYTNGLIRHFLASAYDFFLNFSYVLVLAYADLSLLSLFDYMCSWYRMFKNTISFSLLN